MRYPWLYRLLIVCNIARIISIFTARPFVRLSVRSRYSTKDDIALYNV